MHLDFNSLKILKVNDDECTITLNFEFGMKWTEPRLKISSSDTDDMPKRIPFPQSFVEKLWQPKPVIVGLQNIKIHNHDTVYLVNKTILYCVSEMEVTVYCKMNFNKYPLDSHTCNLWIISKDPADIFKYTLDILDYRTDNQVRLLEYDFKVYGHAVKISDGEGLKERYRAGFDISMDRKIQKYIVNHYVPSGLLVMISWVRLLIYSSIRIFILPISFTQH